MANLYRDDPNEWLEQNLKLASETQRLLFSIRSDETTRHTRELHRLYRKRYITEGQVSYLIKLSGRLLLGTAIVVPAYWFFDLPYWSNPFLLVFLVGSQIGFLLSGMLALLARNKLEVLDADVKILERLRRFDVNDDAMNIRTSAEILKSVQRDLQRL